MSSARPAALSPSFRAESPAARLFTLSFGALFLELMVIRWVPSEVRLVAYYANLMLIGSFLGLGIGAILSPRQWNLFRWFPLLLALDLVFLVGLGAVPQLADTGELRLAAVETRAFPRMVLSVVFLLNALVFVPLGEQIGVQFQRLPPLRAYVWDLAGSLAGTLAFGAFSFLSFSPLVGMGIVIALAVVAGGRIRQGLSLPLYLAALAAVLWSGWQDRTWWSPYHFITVRENRLRFEPLPGTDRGRAWFEEHKVESVPADLRTMRDPPRYNVRVNQDFYQTHGTLDASRYTPGSPLLQLTGMHFAHYELPYRIVRPPAHVLVLGAGGGMDVEAALLHGAQRVDAVEIDPVIMRLSDQFNAAAPYRDPKVVVHIDDARAFLQRTTQRFDLIVFGHLDSQALFSYGTNIRLDGFTYTVESFRTAFDRLNPGGALSISFVTGHEWLAPKLFQMIEAATGQAPLAYVGRGLIFIAARTPMPNPPDEIGEWKLRRAMPRPVALATDDWPYLYLEKPGVPADYAIVIGVLLVLSVAALLAFRGTAFGRSDAHFLFLGWGFLLLQTKSIGDCSLYFGSTWLVTTLVIAGVLLMVLLANWVALRFLARFQTWLYAPLFVSLVLVFALPRELILAQEPGWRVAWTVLVVPLPIFFAGLIFSTTFREAASPPLALGANLIGATIGGFSEYLGMWVGSQALGCLVLAAYAASLLCQWRRGGAAGTPPAAAHTAARRPALIPG